MFLDGRTIDIPAMYKMLEMITTGVLDKNLIYPIVAGCNQAYGYECTQDAHKRVRYAGFSYLYCK
jgi:hypothetical protein